MSRRERAHDRGLVTGLAILLLISGCTSLPATGGPSPSEPAVPLPATRTAGGVLEVEDLAGIIEFTDRTQLALSPDGGLVAFTIRDRRRSLGGAPGNPYFDERGAPRANRGADVYIAYATTGETRKLTAGPGSSWGPVWSPEGDRLAF
jgi:hypothetical protein